MRAMHTSHFFEPSARSRPRFSRLLVLGLDGAGKTGILASHLAHVLCCRVAYQSFSTTRVAASPFGISAPRSSKRRTYGGIQFCHNESEWYVFRHMGRGGTRSDSTAVETLFKTGWPANKQTAFSELVCLFELTREPSCLFELIEASGLFV